MNSLPTIRLREPADIVGMVPYLVGFHPTRSLVVVLLVNGRVLLSARIDLPDEPEADRTYRAALDHLIANVTGRGATDAVLVGYHTRTAVAPGVALATAALTAAGITVLEALQVHDGRFYALLCTNPDCCPPEGSPFDPTTTVAAAKATYAGLTVLPDRDAVAQQLAPIGGPASEAFTAATVAVVAELVRLLENTDQPERELLERGRQAWTDAANCYQAGGVLDDHRAATLTVLLDVATVITHVARQSSGDDWQISLWTDLVRRADRKFVTQPANMLTLCAMQAGDGALAAAAIERALDADPSDGLATVLATVHRHGLAPHDIIDALRG